MWSLGEREGFVGESRVCLESFTIMFVVEFDIKVFWRLIGHFETIEDRVLVELRIRGCTWRFFQARRWHFVWELQMDNINLMCFEGTRLRGCHWRILSGLMVTFCFGASDG